MRSQRRTTDGERLLRAELKRLQKVGFGVELRTVRWFPDLRQDIEAEVVGDTARVYAAEIEGAVLALQHEVFDYEIASCGFPYVRLANKILEGVNQEAYRRKERLANLMVDLLRSPATASTARGERTSGDTAPLKQAAGRDTYPRRGSRRAPSRRRGA